MEALDEGFTWVAGLAIMESRPRWYACAHQRRFVLWMQAFLSRRLRPKYLNDPGARLSAL